MVGLGKERSSSTIHLVDYVCVCVCVCVCVREREREREKIVTIVKTS